MSFKNLETPDELAERWRVKKSWVYSRTRETGPDAMPKVKLGKYIRLEPEQVDAWLANKNKI
jgi:hypothetical protein